MEQFTAGRSMSRVEFPVNLIVKQKQSDCIERILFYGMQTSILFCIKLVSFDVNTIEEVHDFVDLS